MGTQTGKVSNNVNGNRLESSFSFHEFEFFVFVVLTRLFNSNNSELARISHRSMA